MNTIRMNTMLKLEAYQLKKFLNWKKSSWTLFNTNFMLIKNFSHYMSRDYKYFNPEFFLFLFCLFVYIILSY